jgi:hypothetical protein
MEHIRQSRESKLDELGRHSTKLTKSRENIALDNKNDYNLREQEIILGTSYMMDDDQRKNAEMRDMACQTR